MKGLLGFLSAVLKMVQILAILICGPPELGGQPFLANSRRDDSR